MIRQCTKLIGLVFVIIGLEALEMRAIADRSEPELPIRVVRIIVAKDVRDPFFDQLKKFADAYALAIRIAPTSPDGEYFSLQMWRDDIKAIGSNSMDPSVFGIGFYQNGKHPVELASVDKLVAGLESAVTGVRGVTVSQGK